LNGHDVSNRNAEGLIETVNEIVTSHLAGRRFR